MPIPPPQDTVGKLPIICKENESCRFFIKPSYRINALGKMQIINDIILILFTARADDARRFMKRDDDFFLIDPDFCSIYADRLPLFDPVSDTCRLPSDCDTPLFQVTIGLSARTKSTRTEIFINSNLLSQNMVLLFGKRKAPRTSDAFLL